MSKKFKKGQKVWVFQDLTSGIVCKEAIFQERSKVMTDMVRLQGSYGEIVCADTYIFPTKQECIDYITNSIKVIPYD